MPAKTPPATPERIKGLADLANNLGWSWNREARALFRTIDENLWHLCRHNPVAFLRQVDLARLIALSTDPAFLEQYDAVMRWLAAESSFDQTWFSNTHEDLRDKWYEQLPQMRERFEGISFYELPVISKSNPAFRFWLNNGMRSGVPVICRIALSTCVPNDCPPE